MEEKAMPALSKPLSDEFDRYLQIMKEDITKEACRIASKDNAQGISFLHLANAVKEYVPKHGFGETAYRRPRSPWLLSVFSPPTLISMILAVVFGAFGLWAILGSQSDKISGEGYLDIAKIFAGAIVGASTATALRGKD